MENSPQGAAAIFAGSKAVAAVVPIKTQPCDGLKPEQKKAEIRAPGADFAKKRRVAGFLSYLARSAPHMAVEPRTMGHGARGLGLAWLLALLGRCGLLATAVLRGVRILVSSGLGPDS